MNRDEGEVVKAVWKRYLLAGLMASAICVALPSGVGRDVVYCLIGASGAAAILVGIRRNRPDHPAAWYLFAAGTTMWVLADALFGWYEDVALIDPFPSLADAVYLAVFPLFTAGLVLLARSSGAAKGHIELDEAAILTIGLGLLSWVFLISPTWISYDQPLFTRLVGVAYPIWDVILFAVLMRLTTSAGVHNPAFLLVTGSVGVLLIADSLFLLGAFVPAVAAASSMLELGWLLSYVLWGASALHPSMRELSSTSPKQRRRHSRRLSTARLALLGTAVAVGPAVLGVELQLGHSLDVGPVMIAGVAVVALGTTRVGRMMRTLERQADRLGELADTDYTTGLANRRYFISRLEELLAAPRPEVTGVLLVDLDRFSEINDTLGHSTADAILHAVGVRLQELTGDRALVARMGNDLFGILDPSITSGEEADLTALRIRCALERSLDLPSLSVSVEVSVGALVLPEDGREPELLMLRADLALSAARARSERIARYGTDLESGDALAPLVIGELRKAIERHEIVLHFQPQVEICSGRVLSVEALVRWQHPRHGLLYPDTFIPSAEQTGLIGPILRHVLDSALRECAGWLGEGLDLTVAVNLSVRNLLDPRLLEDVRSALQRHGLPARSLELEITESSAMVNPRRSKAVLSALADMGVRLSIDDYGTGHSSLAYLQDLPVERLKIDRSFVSGMANDRASAAIVASTIKLARVLKLDVVAEGVEDDATLLKLRDLKCSTAQGFGLGPPVIAALLPGLVTAVEARLARVLGELSAAKPRR